MPIRPDMKALYPDDWYEIRLAILKREKNRCKFCGVRNLSWGFRDAAGAFHPVSRRALQRRGRGLPPFHLGSPAGRKKIIRIVLTVAHLDNPHPGDCRPENLAALCQRCHNRLDAPMRRANSAATRKQAKAMGDLFAGAGAF